jgi:hypothetical protein
MASPSQAVKTRAMSRRSWRQSPGQAALPWLEKGTMQRSGQASLVRQESDPGQRSGQFARQSDDEAHVRQVAGKLVPRLRHRPEIQ